MKEEHVKHLKEKYPKIYSGRYGGFAVGDGWFNLIDRLSNRIQRYTDFINEQRVKNKDYNLMVQMARDGFWDHFNEYYKNFPSELVERSRLEITGVAFREIPEEVEQVVAVQVKEKFGGLRFYYDGGDRAIQEMVSLAEDLSIVVCEECGAPGKQGGEGWIGTLCPTHRAEHEARRAEYMKKSGLEE
jgi:hypothetical protein